MSAQMSGNGDSRDGMGGPAELVLTAGVARRYYFDRATKSEIAQELNISRFKVARILDAAQRSGLVRIEIDYRGDLDLERSVALQRAYGLRHCLVVNRDDADPVTLRAQLGAVAAGLLTEIVGPGDTLGIAWSRSLMAMTATLRRLAPCAVVQLFGSLPAADSGASALELVRDVARVSGGPAYYFYAPMIVADAATAHALRSQPEIARALTRASEVTVAVAGIGTWQPGGSTFVDALPESEWREIHDLGVRGEVGGIQLDGDGSPVPTPLTDRVIGVSAAQMLAVPEVIGVSYGVAKAGAVRAAMRGKLISGLITHSSLAEALLAAQ